MKVINQLLVTEEILTGSNGLKINQFQTILLLSKECEEEIGAKSDIIVRLEIKTEEISRLLMKLNSLPKAD